MKKKLLSVLIAFMILFSFVPATLLASGDDTGSDIDNAYPVYALDELQDALADPGIAVVEVVDLIVNTGYITVPDGKTLIIRDVGEDPTVLCQMDSMFVVEYGAALINEGSLVAPNTTASIQIYGTFTNRGRISQSIIFSYPGSEFINEASGDIARRNLIYMRTLSSLQNSGTLLCPVYYFAGEGQEPTITGVPAEQISRATVVSEFSEMNFTVLPLAESVSRTVGIAGDESVLMAIWDLGEAFASFGMGYTFEMESMQSISVQSSNEFVPMYYLLDTDLNIIAQSSNGVLHYTTEPEGTFYLIAGGLDVYDTGSFTVTLNEAEFPEGNELDFTASAHSDSGDGWSWDAGTQTLTLDGLVFTGLIDLPGGAVVSLAEGSNNFISGIMDSEFLMSPCMMSSGDLRITGSGNLTINHEYSFGILCPGTLTVDATGAVSVSSGLCSLLGIEGIVIDGCPNLISVSSPNPDAQLLPFPLTGIYSGGPIRITDSKVFAYGTAFAISTGNAYPVVEFSNLSGDITIENSEVYAYCNEAYFDEPGHFEVNQAAAIYAGDFLTPDSWEEHARIILNECKIVSPDGGRIVDVYASGSGSMLNYNCQTITVFPDIEVVTVWGQAAKVVRILPAYDVLYSANGGTGTLEDPLSSYFRSETATVLDNSFTRSGFVFDSWNTAADGTGTSYDPADTFGVVAGVTLYAQWTPLYTVTFEDWDGEVLSTQTVRSGSAATAPADPARDGHTFTGWSVAFTNVTSTLTVTALYDAPTPSVSPTPTTAVSPTPTGNPGGVARTGETGSTDITPWLLLAGGAAAAVLALIMRKRSVLEG